MYKIRVLHNYLYKLIEELHTQLPNIKFQVRDDTLTTSDPQIVEFAKYVFQFQPGLLVIKRSFSTSPEKENKNLVLENYLLC